MAAGGTRVALAGGIAEDEGSRDRQEDQRRSEMMVNEAAVAQDHRGSDERIHHGFEQRVARIEIEVVEEAVGEDAIPRRRRDPHLATRQRNALPAQPADTDAWLHDVRGKENARRNGNYPYGGRRGSALSLTGRGRSPVGIATSHYHETHEMVNTLVLPRHMG
jgi:hypothetical protein